LIPGLTALARGIESIKSLKRLNVSGNCNVSVDATTALCRALATTSSPLETVDLSGCPLSRDVFSLIIQWPFTLKQLYLVCVFPNDPPDLSPVFASWMDHFAHLQTLELSRNNLQAVIFWRKLMLVDQL
jgi:hypothetical protein